MRHIYCLLLCRTRLITIHTLYPWIGYSYRSSSREKRGMFRGIIIIHIVPFGQYIIHHTRHMILIATSSRMVVTLSSVYQVFCTNMIPSYRTINGITQLIVYAWNNSVGNVLGETVGHGHDNKFSIDIIQHISIHYYYRFVVPYVPTPSYIYKSINKNNRRKRRRRVAKSVINSFQGMALCGGPPKRGPILGKS